MTLTPSGTGAPPLSRKRFGQHFLHDAGIIHRILTSFRATGKDHVVEIGPGRGALTKSLAESAGRLDLVEIDRDLATRLTGEFADRAPVHVHQADALDFDFRALRTDGERLRVIGNLPYNVSTPLLFHLLDQADAISDMVFMLQREVVDRIVAAPASGDYGRLSVMAQFFCRAERLFLVPPGAFTPPPKVESAIVRLVPHTIAPVRVDNPAAFGRLVQAAFSQRRKTLRNALRGLVSEEGFGAAGIDPIRRAETLSLQEFGALANESALPFS